MSRRADEMRVNAARAVSPEPLEFWATAGGMWLSRMTSAHAGFAAAIRERLAARKLSARAAAGYAGLPALPSQSVLERRPGRRQAPRPYSGRPGTCRATSAARHGIASPATAGRARLRSSSSLSPAARRSG